MPFASHSQQNTIASGSPVCFMQHILIYTNDYQSRQVPWSGCNCMVLEAGCSETFWSNGIYRQPCLAKDSCGVLSFCRYSLRLGQIWDKLQPRMGRKLAKIRASLKSKIWVQKSMKCTVNSVSTKGVFEKDYCQSPPPSILTCRLQACI